MATKVKMLTLREQISFVRNLGALIGSGLPLPDSLRQLSRLLPKQKEKIEEMAVMVERGRYLSHACSGLLPEELISAIVVGEQSGKMESVLFEIRDTLAMRLRMKKTSSKLMQPAMMFFFGITVFVGFVMGVIPTLSETSSKLQPPGRPVHRAFLMDIMVGLANFFHTWGLMLLVMLLLSIVGIALWSKTAQGRISLYRAVLKVPFIGNALKNIDFALWARYMALMWRAGYADMPKAIGITMKSMPLAFRPGVELYQRDISMGRGLGAACDPRRLNADDPRHEWPMLLQVALQISEKSMQTDDQLTSASIYMLEDAETIIDRLVELSRVFVLVLVAATAALPIIAYMFEVITLVSGTLSSSLK
ncbi:type II secretion system F family protein [Pseudomonas luteola]